MKLRKQNGSAGIGMLLFALGMSAIVLVGFTTMYSWAHFRLWKAEYSGKALQIEKEYYGRAVLAEAKHAKMARIESAKAEKESAQLTADAIKIVGQAAKDYPEYRNQEFILAFGEALKSGTIEQIMYIPTEANIPITEANRLK